MAMVRPPLTPTSTITADTSTPYEDKGYDVIDVC